MSEGGRERRREKRLNGRVRMREIISDREWRERRERRSDKK